MSDINKNEFTVKACIFTNGSDNSPQASIVPSNYIGAKPNEYNVLIEGQCSIESLKAILSWAEKEIKELQPTPDKPTPTTEYHSRCIKEWHRPDKW